MLNIDEIQNGIVIDHIKAPAGQAQERSPCSAASSASA